MKGQPGLQDQPLAPFSAGAGPGIGAEQGGSAESRHEDAELGRRGYFAPWVPETDEKDKVSSRTTLKGWTLPN
jgi:hypothetical protein